MLKLITVAIFSLPLLALGREPDRWAALELEWVGHVPGQGEFRRYPGDHVLTENDVRDRPAFPDAVVENDGAFCLHHAGHRRYDFRLPEAGWRVLYLGPSLPAEDIALAAIGSGAAAVAVSAVTQVDRKQIASELTRLRAALPPDVRLFAGGLRAMFRRRRSKSRRMASVLRGGR